MKDTRNQGSIWFRWLTILAWTVLCVLAGIGIYNVAGHGAFLGHFDKIWGSIF